METDPNFFLQWFVNLMSALAFVLVFYYFFLS